MIQAQGGQRTIQKTLSTRVDFAKLELEPSHHLNVSPSGRIAKIGWLARNAVRCSVFVNDKLVDANAPVDTYLERDRYYLLFTGEAGSHKIEIVAHGASGAQTSLQLSRPVIVGEAIQVSSTGRFRGAGITTDGKFAFLLPAADQNNVAVIDISNRKQLNGIEARDPASFVGVPDPKGMKALVTGRFLGAIVLRSPQILTPVTIRAALAAGRRLALLKDTRSFTSFVIPPPLPLIMDLVLEYWGVPVAVAITPDEKFAYVALNPDPRASPKPAVHWSLGVVDLSAAPLKMRPLEITVGMDLADMAMSPDGTRAILTGMQSDSPAKVVNLENREIIDTIAGAGPGVAFMPDGRTALLGLERSVGVYHLGRREFHKWNANFPARILAISPGGPVALAASAEGRGVYLL